jgi:hypothetical protein
MSKSAIGMRGDELAAGRPYAERPEPEPGLHDRLAEFLLARAFEPVRDWLRDPTHALRRIVEQVERHERSLLMAADSDLATQARSWANASRWCARRLRARSASDITTSN